MRHSLAQVMLDPVQKRMLRSEAVVGIGLNTIVPPAIIWLLRAAPPRTLVGAEPIVAPMAGASGIATLVMTFVITALIEARVRRGAVRALAPADVPPLLLLLPRSRVARAIACALLALVLFVPLGLAVCAPLHIVPLTRPSFLLFNMVFGAIVGAVMAPLVTLRALVVEPRR